MTPTSRSDLVSSLADATRDGIPVGRAGVARLRRPVTADAAPYVLACNDAAARRWTELPSPYDHGHAVDFIERLAPQGLLDGSAVAFTIADPDDDVLGVVSLQRLDENLGALVGYWVAPQARGRGVGTAALSALAGWSFDVLGLRRLEWRAAVGNTASLVVATHVGFRPEGTTRRGLRLRTDLVDGWVASLQPDDPREVDPVRAAAAVEIAAGAWQLQPAGPDQALVAEAVLPFSACLPPGLWAVRHAVTAATEAVVALLVADGRGWVVSVGVDGGGAAVPASSAAEAGRGAVERYARLALGLQLP